MKRLLLLAYIVSRMVCNVSAFQSIKDIHRFVEQYPEYPDTDRPLSSIHLPVQATFDTYLKSYETHWFVRLIQFFGIGKKGWNFDQFDARLHRISLRDTKKMSDSSAHVMMGIQSTAHDPVRIIIIGAITGNIHALSRILSDMMGRGIVDENLVIKDKHTYILFLGDIIGASPYNLEALDAALLLLERNTDRAIYVRGWSESNQRWQLFPMITELHTKSLYTDVQLREFMRRLDSFFSQLPAACLITGADKHAGILCAPREVRQALTTDQLMRCASRMQSGTIEECPILTEAPGVQELKQDDLRLLAKFSTTIFEDTYYPMSLLHIFVSREIAPVWHFISASAGVYRALYRCRYEGYFMCAVAPVVDQTTVVPVSRKIDSDQLSYTVNQSVRITDTTHSLLL